MCVHRVFVACALTLSLAAAAPALAGWRIVHGQVTSEWPATAALMDFDEQFCTGTLIAPTVVLTAAHCLEDGPFDEVYFGDNPAQTGERIGVADLVMHPDYDPWELVDAADIGLVFLEHAASAEPAHLDTSDAWDLLGQQIVYVGFGSAEGTGGEGYKKEANASIEDIDGDTLVVRPDDGSACWGDSGGPLYRIGAQGETLVSGVVSFGYTDDCMDLGGNTRTDVYADWVERTIAAGPGASGQDDWEDDGDTGWDTGWGDDWDTGWDERPGACSTGAGSSPAPALLPLLLLAGLAARRRD